MVESSRSTSSRYRGGVAGSATVQPPRAPAPAALPAAVVTLQYFGSHLDLSHRWIDPRDEVIVEQQPSGGNTVYVYRNRLSPGGMRRVALRYRLP